MLTPDQFAFWTLIVGIVAAIAAIVGAIAAIYAAKYAKDAPTKADFSRLEQHAADTSGHLEKQNRREELNSIASRVYLKVSGRSQQDESLQVYINLQDPSVRLTRVDMLNESKALYGSGICEMKEPNCYVAHLESRNVQNWFNGGVQKGNTSHLWLRVFMAFEEDGEGHKDMPVMLLPTQIGSEQRPGYPIACWQIIGEV